MVQLGEFENLAVLVVEFDQLRPRFKAVFQTLIQTMLQIAKAKDHIADESRQVTLNLQLTARAFD